MTTEADLTGETPKNNRCDAPDPERSGYSDKTPFGAKEVKQLFSRVALACFHPVAQHIDRVQRISANIQMRHATGQ
jgi:hypothetical protein